MTFREINVRGKSIIRTFRNNIANYSARNDIQITCNHMPGREIYIIRILTISGVRIIGIYIYIIYNFIKVKYSRHNRLLKITGYQT